MKTVWPLALLAAAPILFLGAQPEPATARAQVSRTAYHGWPDAIVLRSKQAEVIIVPEIGRIMSFRLLGGSTDGENPIWNNRELEGHAPDQASEAWLNFGGEKTWPAPQDGWAEKAGRAWPPPPEFDAASVALELPGTAGLGGNQLALVFPAGRSYGIRVRRVLTLASDEPNLTVDTTFEKIHGAPVSVSVWVVAQLNDPDRVYARIPFHSRLKSAFVNLGQTPLFELKRQAHLVSIRRDPGKPTKIGSEGDSLLWTGAAKGGKVLTLRIDTHPLAQIGPTRSDEWPDHGSRVEIYTNPGDAQKYVELETLGPLTKISAGQSIGQRNVYTLRVATEADVAKLRDTEF
jgi:hypothetical protein